NRQGLRHAAQREGGGGEGAEGGGRRRQDHPVPGGSDDHLRGGVGHGGREQRSENREASDASALNHAAPPRKTRGGGREWQGPWVRRGWDPKHRARSCHQAGGRLRAGTCTSSRRARSSPAAADVYAPAHPAQGTPPRRRRASATRERGS